MGNQNDAVRSKPTSGTWCQSVPLSSVAEAWKIHQLSALMGPNRLLYLAPPQMSNAVLLALL